MDVFDPSLRLTIALCTYNGAPHLAAQLESYLVQTHTAWDLWVSDDGSDDSTRALLEAFGARHGSAHTVRILAGPRAGVAVNFLSLLCHAEFPDAPVALSDQDDVWLPEKLALGLAQIHGTTPCLYGAQSIHTDIMLNHIGRSMGGGAPRFGNALVQNIVSGHSAILNSAALSLVRAAGVPQDVPYHDWWIYQLVTGAGGKVVVRPEAVLLYRQHGRNATGSHQGLGALVARVGQLFGGTYGRWIAANARALSKVAPLLTPQTRATLAMLEKYPRSKGFARARNFAGNRILRQGRVGNVMLYLAILTGRV